MATENKTRNGHFVLIPLSMIRGLIQNPGSFDRMAETGIYLSSRKLEVKLDNAINAFIVFRYSSGALLGSTMIDWYLEMGDSYPLQEQFVGKKITDLNGHRLVADISREREFVTEFILSHPDFEKDLLSWFRVMQMCHNLSYKFCERTLVAYEVGKTIMEGNPEYEKDPLIALDGEVLANMWEAVSKSTPELRARWCMYLGMLSIIGTKQLAETTSVAIKSRMFGAKDKKTLQDVLSDEETRKLYDFWTSRRHYEGLLAQIEYSNKIKAQGMGRRTYISYRFDNDLDFVTAICKGSVQKQVRCARNARKELISSLRKEEKKV